MCYNQTGDISTLDGTPLKLVDKFTYLGSSVSSTEKDNDLPKVSFLKRLAALFSDKIPGNRQLGIATLYFLRQLSDVNKNKDGIYMKNLNAMIGS